MLSSSAPISIGVLSERTGVSVRALRYYEQNGLLVAARTAAGHRCFPREAVESVRRIRLFLDAGLPIAAVAQLLTCFDDDGKRLHSCVARILRDRMDIVQERMEQLDQQRGTIERLRQLIV